MAGQAVIKSVAFGANAWALVLLDQMPAEAGFIDLAIAASFSGFVTSFLVNPIERIKVLMQSDQTGRYSSELDCMTQIGKL